MTRTYVIGAALGAVIVAGGAVYLLRAPRHHAVALPPAKTIPAPHPVGAVVPPPAVPAPAAAGSTANAGCLPPQTVPPTAPDGATATDAEMRAGHDRVQAFVDQLEAYQKCLNAAADTPGTSPEQQQVLIDQGNGAIDEAELLAKAFAAQLAAFKAKHPDQAGAAVQPGTAPSAPPK